MIEQPWLGILGLIGLGMFTVLGLISSYLWTNWWSNKADIEHSVPSNLQKSEGKRPSLGQEVGADTKQMETAPLSHNDEQAWAEFIEWLDSLDRPNQEKLNQIEMPSSLAQDGAESTEEPEVADKNQEIGALTIAESSQTRERERLIMEIKERLAVLAQRYAELSAEDEALPPRVEEVPEGRAVTREQLEREQAIDRRRLELSQQIGEVEGERIILKQRLTELQKKQ